MYPFQVIDSEEFSSVLNEAIAVREFKTRMEKKYKRSLTKEQALDTDICYDFDGNKIIEAICVYRDQGSRI